MASYAIGDVQGCYDELMALLQKIAFDPQHDKLWFCGDLINRGPDSLKTLRFIKQLGSNAISVLGNHDLHFLAVASGAVPLKKKDTLQALLDAPDCQALCQWLRQQPLLHIDHQLNFCMAHAGIAPMWDLKKAAILAKEVEHVLQGINATEFFNEMYGNEPSLWDDSLTGWPRLRCITNYFTRMRFCDKKGRLAFDCKSTPGEQGPHLFPWFSLPARPLKHHNIVFGHWAALQGKSQTPHAYAIDTACVWGGQLTALRLDDLRLFTLDSAKNYSQN